VADPWAKVWWTWYTSRSHIGLSGVALALGAPLMLIGRACAKRHSDGHSDGECDGQPDVTRDAENDLVWCRNEDDSAVSPADLAAIVRFDVGAVEAALKELVGRKTLKVSPDGCYGIVNFWKYQESASAARTRKLRDKKKRHSDGHSDGECDAKRDGSCDDKKGEGRSKSNSSSAEPKPATLVKAVKPRKRSERDGMFDLVRDVFEAAHMAAHGVPAGVSGSLVSRLVEKWVKPMAPEKRADAVRQAVAGFFADPYWREQGKHPFAQFEQQPGAFVKQASPASSGSLGDQGWRVGLP
jgi:hypothetical protein